MRIAILTLPLNTNYGGILQCYALQTVLERMGHEVVVIDTANWTSYPKMSLLSRLILFFKRFIKYYILGSESKFYGGKSETQIILENTREFIVKYIHQLKIQSLDCLKEEDFDAFIVGSDQIWRPSYYEDIENAYLGFARSWRNIKRIAYAVSFGSDKWEYSPEQTMKCKDLVSLFNAVSVREDSGINLCMEYLHINAVQVLDPVLLLKQSDFSKLLINKKIKEKGLFCYILDKSEEKKLLVKNISERVKLEPFYVSTELSHRHAPFEERIRPPVEDWIMAFQTTDFVITDSFHGCVFSILFNKPFFVLTNIDRGITRLESLLSILSLQDRLITSKTENIQNLILSDIDWNTVNSNLERLRQKSYSFLQSCLS